MSFVMFRSALIPMAVGASLAGTLYSQSRMRILNDTGAYGQQPTQTVRLSGAQGSEPVTLSSHKFYTDKGIARFDGRLDYHQLTWGSFTGLLSGYLFGKVSKVLATMILSGVALVEYLQYTGQVNVNPWANTVYRWGIDHLDQEILVKDPSFKVSFVAAFIIAALNS